MYFIILINRLISILKINNTGNKLEMAEVISELVDCYICGSKVDKQEAMEVPLTTGGIVFTHPACLEMYLSQASAPSACSTCSVTDSCSSCDVPH